MEVLKKEKHNIILLTLTMLVIGTTSNRERFETVSRANRWVTEKFVEWYPRHKQDVPNLSTITSCGLCPVIYYPVCGNDSRTYTNECKMACLNVEKKKNPIVRMVRTGPCLVFPGDEEDVFFD